MSKAQKITGSAKRKEGGANLSSIICYLSVVFVFALFVRTMAFSYIGLDDAAYTFRNPFVAGGLSIPNVVEAFTNLRHGGIWMPVTYISYMLDASICRWTGMPLIGEMHFVNVLLHTVNFLLLQKLIALIFGRAACPHAAEGSTPNSQLPTVIAALAATIWAVHPLRAEPVAWIAARKELLWSLFTLCGLILWIKGMRNGDEQRSPKLPTTNHEPPTRNYPLSVTRYHLSSVICCALACLSKPTAMCFPFLLLLVTWWLRKEDSRTANHRLSTLNAQPSTPNSTRSTRFSSHGFKLPTRNSKHETRNDQLSSIRYHLSSVICHLSVAFAIAAATAAIAAYSQTHVAGQDSVALYAAPISHRLVQALSAIGYYIRATFWPFGLHVDCRAVSDLWPLGAGWNFAALGVAVLAVGLWKYLTLNSQLSTLNSTQSTRSTRLIIFSSLWFLIALSPTLGLFGSFGMEAHADRFSYLPSMAFAFLIAGFAFVEFRVSSFQFGVGGGEAVNVKPTPKSQLPTPSSTRSTRLNSKLPTLNSKLLTLTVLVLLSLVTFQQLSYWRDDWAAHQRVLDCDPGHPRAMVHVADARCSRQRDFDGGVALYRKALSRMGDVPAGGFNVFDVKARLAYALASRGGYDDFVEVKNLGGEVLRNFRLDRRGMMLDALGTAFMAEGDLKRAALLFQASIEAPDRFWPKASTRRKLESCK